MVVVVFGTGIWFARARERERETEIEMLDRTELQFMAEFRSFNIKISSLKVNAMLTMLSSWFCQVLRLLSAHYSGRFRACVAHMRDDVCICNA